MVSIMAIKCYMIHHKIIWRHLAHRNATITRLGYNLLGVVFTIKNVNIIYYLADS